MIILILNNKIRSLPLNANNNNNNFVSNKPNNNNKLWTNKILS